MAKPFRTYPFPDAAKVIQRIKDEGGPTLTTAPTGETETHGCKLSWIIAGQQITITRVSKPFFISDDQIFGELDKLFATT